MVNLLLCFPFAGAGASFFRSWSAPLGHLFEILPVQLPGREKRFNEQPYKDVVEAVRSLIPELTPKLQEKSDVIAFGHSLGAVLAYELAVQLISDEFVRVKQLIVSGSPAPTRPRARRATGLSDDKFLEKIRSFAGYSHPALEDPEMRELLLPILRADVEMHENYVPSRIDMLHIPIICVRGRSDELVSAEDAATWQEVTSLPLQMIEVDGGHMYLVDEAAGLFEVLEGVCLDVS